MTASRQSTVYTVQQQEREERQQWQTKFQNVCRFFLFLASTREKLLKARQGVEWKLHTHRHTHTHTQTNTVRETNRQAHRQMETQLRLARHTRRMHNILGKGCDSARRQRRHMQMHFWHEPSGGQNVLITCRQAQAGRKRDRQAGSQTNRERKERE